MTQLLLTKDNFNLWNIYREKCISRKITEKDKKNNECNNLYKKLFIEENK
jgi:hypothetical protein